MSRFLVFAALFIAVHISALEIAHHDLFLDLDPSNNHINVVDTLRCDEGTSDELSFVLHGKLKIQVKTPGWKLQLIGKLPRQMSGINAYYKNLDKFFPIHSYKLIPTEQVTDKTFVKITYSGNISLPPQASQEEYVRSFSETPGIVSTTGVYLTSTSLWYPQNQYDRMVTFRLEAKMPPKWELISQGKEEKSKSGCVVWNCEHPMEEIYLVGGPLVKFERNNNKVKSLVYLRQDDSALADKYLVATAQYIEMYNKLLGTYPYTKFALVENFWETGYGMPSFTLLGSRIIRFPFILRSSYPHEILHNWWGNGVFVAYEKGNWCEGLTAYLADHLLKEQEGKGTESRRRTLQRYRNFVRSDEDFPLTQFRSRHSSATEAVGYGKCLMLFHELRQKLGDKVFIECLRKFYEEFLFKKATFSNIEQVFSKTSQQNLSSFFQKRVEEKGAPDIIIDNVYLEKSNQLHFKIQQAQPGLAYQLQIPVAITMSDSSVVYENIILNKKQQSFSFSLKKSPVRIDVDPEFDIFRKVHRSEIPTSFGQLFGATKSILVARNPNQYQSVLQKWGRGKQMKMLQDKDFHEMPADSSVWFLGEHSNSEKLKTIFREKHGVRFNKSNIQIGNEAPISLKDHIVVLCTQHSENEDLAIGWILGDKLDAIPAVARKLPHYGKYSYLAFADTEANNKAKGQWSILQSKMTYHLTSKRYAMGKLPQRQALADLPVMINDSGLKRHVSYLASAKMEGRGLGTPQLDEAADYIASFMQKIGLRPGNGNSYFQSHIASVTHPSKKMKVQNVVGMIPGTNPKLQQQPIILGAHYDHLGKGWPDVRKGNKGKIHFGADDNASGVAVMLEMAKIFARKGPQQRPVIFIAFSGEEAGRLGSKYYANQLGNVKPFAMVNLDSVGRLNNNPLLALGTGTAREWPFICFGCSAVTNVKITSIPKSEDSSDHTSFWEKGIPAIQLFSGPHTDYHSPGDTIDKIDFSGMVKTMLVLQEIMQYLANREKPMTIQGQKVEQKTPQKQQGKRRASLGSIPDFAYRSGGVKISGVVPESAAQKGGMQKGDIILRLGKWDISDLRSLSNALKDYQPGDKVIVVYKRGNTEKTISVILKER